MSAAHAVVTGGSGFIGSHLVERLLRRGDEVTVFDAVKPHADTRFVQGDIRDADALAKAIGKGVDVVYHLAAVVGVDQYLSRPLDVIDINFGATRHVLDLAARNDAKVVLASTSEVFGKNPTVPWAEDGDRVLGATSADRWVYASAKALSEHMAFGFVRQHGLNATIVRYFNVYGPRQRPAYIVSRSIHRALNDQDLAVYDDGAQTRCFTFVRDAVEGTVCAADSPKSTGEAFNIGSMTETTVGEAIALIHRLTGTKAGIKNLDTQRALGAGYEDLGRRQPDNAKAGLILGWQPKTALPDGLAETIAWARENPWWLALKDSGAS